MKFKEINKAVASIKRIYETLSFLFNFSVNLKLLLRSPLIFTKEKMIHDSRKKHYKAIIRVIILLLLINICKVEGLSTYGLNKNYPINTFYIKMLKSLWRKWGSNEKKELMTNMRSFSISISYQLIKYTSLLEFSLGSIFQIH